MLDSCIDSWQSGIGFRSLHLWDAFSFENVRINLPLGLQTISWLLAAFVWCFLSLPKVRVGVITLSFRYHGMGKKGILSKGWVYTLFLLVRSPESQWLKPKPEGETMNKEPGDSYAKHIYRNGVAERSFQHLDSGFGGNGRPETWVWLLVWYPVEFHYGNPTRNMCFFPSSWQVEDFGELRNSIRSVHLRLGFLTGIMAGTSCDSEGARFRDFCKMLKYLKTVNETDPL